MPKSFLLSYVIILVGGLLACTPKPSAVLDDISCNPPCWNNIKPGSTPKEDVLTILPTMPEIDASSIRSMWVSSPNDSVIWNFDANAGDIGGIVIFKDGVVSAIQILPKKGGLTVGDTVEKLGDPEKYMAILGEGERSWLSIYLLYTSKGIATLSNITPFHRGDKAVIQPDQHVDVIWYFDPYLFEELMSNFVISNYKPGTLGIHLQRWEGFGEVEYTER